jgi:hypothetical protein
MSSIHVGLASIICACWISNASLAESQPSSALEADGDVVKLETFVVSADQVGQKPWRYVEIPGYQILSRCDDGETEQWLKVLIRGQQLEDLLFPEGVLPTLSSPTTVILYDAMPKQQAFSSAIPVLPEASFQQAMFGNQQQVQQTNGSTVSDLDTVVDCFEMPAILKFEPAYKYLPSTRDPSLRFRLEKHLPSFPPWLIQGLFGAQGLYKFRAVAPPRDNHAPHLELSYARWVTDDETYFVKHNHTTHFPLLSPRIFFGQTYPEETNNQNVWTSQASLFVRWGIYGQMEGQNEVQASRFWKFVNESLDGPVTEKRFEEIFGFDYDHLNYLLEIFLPVAVRGVLVLPIKIDWDPDIPDIRNASEGEIGALLGNWERLKAQDFESSNPTLSAFLKNEARKTLYKAYSAGYQNPALFEGLGLYESLYGEQSQALTYLEKAVNNNSSRPSVYLQLANIYLKQALLHPEGSSSSISETQMLKIRTAIDRARSLSPAMPQTYEIYAKALKACKKSYSDQDVRIINEGRRLFWTDRSLLAALNSVKMK